MQTFETGQDIGYIYTDFTYPGDLIGNAGDTVTTILDKIKNVLGNYEYFYDIFGNFVFQEIKNYLNTSQAEYISNDMQSKKTTLFVPDFVAGGAYPDFSTKDLYLSNTSFGKSVFKFENSELVNSYSNTPQYNMIKNDFVVWGVKKVS